MNTQQKKELSFEEKEKIVQYIGDVYKRAKRRIAVVETGDFVNENRRSYGNDRAFVELIDRTLMDCSQNTRLIIVQEYFKKPEPKWYIAYYSRSSFYRRKRESVSEFLDCLDI